LTFDEQLQRVLDTFSSRLQEEVTQQVRSVADELAAAARAQDERAAATHAEEQAAATRAQDERVAAVRAQEQAAAARAQDELAAAARTQQAGAEPVAATERLANAIRAMSGARSLSEVLDTLVSGAGREAARAGVLLVRGDRLHGWRLLGFDPPFASDNPLTLARQDAGIIAEAAENGTLASSGPDAHDSAPAFAHLPAGRGCVAVPISIGEQVVAVLYTDEGVSPETATLNSDSLEILARFASQRLEALTAIKAARSLSVKADRADPASRQSDDAVDDHAAARRYARLLVSEIKLYHEPQVVEGRRERDLATRLGGEIARVRTLYEQRVPAEIRESTDYVHEELIRTLADGDASLLEVKT
jgi:hypothetical protein